MEIGASARLLAILGDPVAHSLSPLMHNAAIDALGLDAVYVALRTPAADLETVLRALAAVDAAGNVTVPHKEAVEGYVARKTELCARVGACNTFWTERGTLIGDNTDVPGVVAALRALGDGADRAERWLVVGTGGAARAVAIAAADAGAQLRVRSRDPARAREFVAWAASRGAAAGAAADREPCDVVINATPVGLKEKDAMPIAVASLEGARAGLDLVYARGETPWVRALRAAGLAAADGRELLVRQGAAAFARFFPDQTPPVEVMRAAVARALRA